MNLPTKDKARAFKKRKGKKQIHGPSKYEGINGSSNGLLSQFPTDG